MAGVVIRKATDFPHVRKWGGYRQWVEHLAIERWRGAVPTWQPGNSVACAEIIRSNWVAECPHCQSYILIEPDELFFCPDCLMQGSQGYAAFIRWPDQIDAIVEALAQRADPATRNWLLHETLDDLRRENAEHQEQ
jgi:hypothetical protein